MQQIIKEKHGYISDILCSYLAHINIRSTVTLFILIHLYRAITQHSFNYNNSQTLHFCGGSTFKTARIASSKTSLIPVRSKAEHSKYLRAFIPFAIACASSTAIIFSPVPLADRRSAFNPTSKIGTRWTTK